MPPAEPTIAATQARHLADLAGRWGVTPDALFAGLGLDLEAVSDPRRRLPFATFERVVARARALTGEPGLGFHLGLGARVSAFGYLGFAAMAAPTLGAAIDLAVRYLPTRTDALALRFRDDGAEASLFLDELAPLGEARDVLVISLLVGLREMAAALTGRSLRDRAEAAFPEPPYAARFPHLVRDRLRFGRPAHRIVLPAEALALPLVLADPGALRLAQEQCDRELDALRRDGPITAEVHAHLPREGHGFRSLAEIARRLHVSERTLKRRLAAEGTEFSALLEEQRRARALLRLRAPGVSVAEIAEELGYSDVANFTRAFRRWTGSTPSAYRRAGG